VNCGDAWRDRKNVFAPSSTEGAGAMTISIVGFACSDELLSIQISGSTLLLRSFSGSSRKTNCSRLMEHGSSSIYADISSTASSIPTSATSCCIADDIKRPICSVGPISSYSPTALRWYIAASTGPLIVSWWVRKLLANSSWSVIARAPSGSYPSSWRCCEMDKTCRDLGYSVGVKPAKDRTCSISTAYCHSKTE
jgi:hypothetical protein